MQSINNRLFLPQKLGAIELTNRLTVAPMTRISTTADGFANDTMRRYYERFAKGGFAGVITEGIYIDRLYSQGVLQPARHCRRKPSNVLEINR